MAASDVAGYGVFGLGGRLNHRNIKAHRFAWVIKNGEIQGGLQVLHKCDNPSCCNVDHLFLGTQKDNMLDMKTKKRGMHDICPETNARGERVNTAKLTARKVIRIRSIYASGKMSQYALARKYGVDRPAIGKIIRRENWKHV